MVWMTDSPISMQKCLFRHRSVGLELKEGVHCKDFAGRFQLPSVTFADMVPGCHAAHLTRIMTEVQSASIICSVLKC